MNIKLTIDRFEEDKVVLKTDDNQTIIWPKNKLPAEAREGAVITFNIITDAKEEKNKQEQAKEILNEILSVDEDKK